ncbi:hypothetical protein [Mycobacteroides abscessus]|uniref:hypothetical protein n=1 Tax=Mycobacteroides abscessus TaxID=36809 RepID=UPI001055FC9C|nr:hypothetical protein [Mycobacteroides abscessus]
MSHATPLLVHRQVKIGAPDSIRRDEFRNRLAKRVGPNFGALAHVVSSLEREKIVIFRDFSEGHSFSELVQLYDRNISAFGSQHPHLNHSFVDFGLHGDLLCEEITHATILHPYLIALVALHLGGPIRLIDARAKDTGPAWSIARDNGVHLDDTPFGRELKTLLLWEKGGKRGPNSQNFVAITGAHDLVRVNATEHGSNFKTPDAIVNEILCNRALGSRPKVIEATDDKPLTILFEGSAVPHHRFRTLSEEAVRSALLMAFHVDDERERPAYIYKAPSMPTRLAEFVVGGAEYDEDYQAKEEYFLDAIEEASAEIEAKALDINQHCGLISTADKRMSRGRLLFWLTEIGTTPTTSTSRPKMPLSLFKRTMAVEKFLKAMQHDKHHDMDLKLYTDRSEIKRLRARNYIREMSVDDILKRKQTMHRIYNMGRPRLDDLLDTASISDIASLVAAFFEECTEFPDPEWAGSFAQLSGDLAEAAPRARHIQDVRTLLVILYWVLDIAADEFLPAMLDGVKLKELSIRCLRAYRMLAWLDDLTYREDVVDRRSLRISIERSMESRAYFTNAEGAGF